MSSSITFESSVHEHRNFKRMLDCISSLTSSSIAIMKSIIYLEKYCIVTCKQCMHVIWSSQVKTHFTSSNHRWSVQRVQDLITVIDEISLNWIRYFMKFKMLNYVDSAVSKLKICTNDLICQLKLDDCRYICCNAKKMQIHCKQKHEWKQQMQRERSSQSDQIRQRSSDALESWKIIVCQRFFVQKHESQYVEVKREIDVALSENENDSTSRWDLIRKKMTQIIDTIKEKKQRVIQTDEINKINSWLKRIEWHTYLTSLNREELIASMRKLNLKIELIIIIIWDVMNSLIQHCQQSMMSWVDVFICMKIIRIKKHQTRYQSLQSYMNVKRMMNYSWSWKQILMFMIQIKRAHDWVDFKYKFNKTQRDMWKRLFSVATEIVEKKNEKNFDEKKAAESMKKSNDSSQNFDEDNKSELMRIQKTCLNFCLALLDDCITRKKYNSSLMCTLMILRIQENEWKNASNYSLILFIMIKISWFMMIQQELKMSWRNVDESRLDSRDSQSSVSSFEVNEFIEKECLKSVVRMMNWFMMQDSHNLMQWMMNLRTYELKIHFNIISDDHIDWVNDQILYKSIQFSMSDFRDMIHELMRESHCMLMKDLMFKDVELDSFWIAWWLLRDNSIENTWDWNFIQNVHNQLIDAQSWLFDQINQNENVKRKFIKSDQELIWNQVEIEKYMHQMMKYREKLLMLIHVIDEQLIRASKLLSVRHSNIIKEEHWNVFVKDELMMFMTRYHKNYIISEDVKMIHRYLSWEMRELMLYYLWLMLSFQQRLKTTVWKTNAISTYMWSIDLDEKKWTSKRMCKMMKRKSLIELRVKMMIASYRELMIEISCRYMQEREFQMNENNADDDWQKNEQNEMLNLQMKHTTHVVEMIYAREIMKQSDEIISKRQKFREFSKM